MPGGDRDGRLPIFVREVKMKKGVPGSRWRRRALSYAGMSVMDQAMPRSFLISSILAIAWALALS